MTNQENIMSDARSDILRWCINGTTKLELIDNIESQDDCAGIYWLVAPEVIEICFGKEWLDDLRLVAAQLVAERINGWK